MTLAAEPEILTPNACQASKSTVFMRLAAGAGGLLVLACTAVISVGTVLIALLGMAVVGGVQRKRGRALTRTGHWVAACATMTVVVLVLAGALFSSAPGSPLDAAKHAMDSTSAASAKEPPPAWLERLYPQYRQARASAKAKPSPVMVWGTIIFGLGLAITLFATLLGTLSWGAGMLLGLAAAGRWPGVRGESLEDLVAEIPVAIAST